MKVRLLLSRRLPAPVVGAGLSMVGKGLGLVTQLSVVFLVTRYMTKDEYGALAMVVAAGTMAQLADVGLSQPLINLAAANSAGNLSLAELRDYSSTAFFCMSFFALFCAVLGVTAIFGTQLGFVLFGIPSSVNTALAITVVTYLLSLPFFTAQKLQTGFQQYLSQYTWQFVGSLAALISVFAVTIRRLPASYVVAALQIPVALGILANWLYFHWAGPVNTGKALRPRLSEFGRVRLVRLFGRGLTPMVAQISSALIYAAPVWCMGKLFGTTEAGAFFTIYRLLSPVSIACSLLVTPLWPACAKAAGSGDTAKVRKLLSASLAVAALVSVVGFPVMLGVGRFAGKLAGVQIDANVAISSALAGWFLLMNCRQSLTMVVLGLGFAHRTTIAYAAALVTTFLLPQLRGVIPSPVHLMMVFVGIEVIVISALCLDLQKSLAGSAPVDEIVAATV
jgi:O-antigen/teichoic acid export membrane protein